MSPRKRKMTPESVALQPPFLPLAPARLPDSVKPSTRTVKVTPVPDDGDFVRGSKWNQVRKTNAYEGDVWLYSPARLECLAEASDALLTVARLMGLPDGKITRVEVILQLSTRKLYIRPATEEAEEYYDVVESSNEYIVINIRSLLQPENLEVKKGYQQRHKVVLDANSAVGPALVIDLDQIEERRLKSSVRRARQAVEVGAVAGASKANAKIKTNAKATSGDKAKRPNKATAAKAAGAAETNDATAAKAAESSTKSAAPAPAAGAMKGQPATPETDDVDADLDAVLDDDEIDGEDEE